MLLLQIVDCAKQTSQRLLLYKLIIQRLICNVIIKIHLIFVIKDQHNLRPQPHYNPVQFKYLYLSMEHGQLKFPDAYRQAIIHRIVKKTPEIRCPSGMLVVNMCINPKCKNSLRCSGVLCNTCGPETHGECPYVSLQCVTKLVNKKIEPWMEKITDIFMKEEQLINNIRKAQQVFLERFMANKLSNEEMVGIFSIYEDRNYHGLSGQQAHLMYQQLKEDSKIVIKADPLIQNLEKYRNNLDTINRNIRNLRDEYFLKPDASLFSQLMKQNLGKIEYKFDKQINPQVEPHKIPLKRQLHHKKQERDLELQIKIKKLKFDSEILRLKNTIDQDKKFLYIALYKPKQLQLLFRASEHAFKAKAFHDHCDGVENLLVLVRTEFGKTIGGFTHYKWTKEMKNMQFSGRRAYMLQLDLQQYIHPVKTDSLISYDENCGPIFGKGADLLIDDNCNTQATSYCQIGWTYNIRGYYPYHYFDENSFRKTSGSNDPYGRFKVVEYEVFKVIR